MNANSLTVIAFFPLAIICGAYAAFVLALLWGWFIVPLGVPAISMFHAWGLTVIVNMFTARRKVDFVEGMVVKTGALGALAKGFGISTGALLIGFVLSIFI